MQKEQSKKKEVKRKEPQTSNRDSMMRNRLMGTFFLLLAAMAACGQALTKKQDHWLQKNAKEICGEKLAEPDWSYLLPGLKNKKIILLGEFTHGAKEIFQLRNSLIKYLHQELGIKVILLESGIGELMAAEMYKESMTPGQMINGLFSGWRTKEWVELMDYVKAEKISIAGFDVQRSGGSFSAILTGLAAGFQIDSLYYYDLEARYGVQARELINRRTLYDSVKTKTMQLIADYRALLGKFPGGSTGEKNRELLFARATIANRVSYLSYMLEFTRDKDWNKKWAARDAAMAANIEWLRDNCYRDQPVIIIAHNFHIAKWNENETTMGELLKEKWGNEMYALGVFAGAGSYHDNGGKEIPMLQPDSTGMDIKHIINKLKGKANFMAIPPMKRKGGNWLDKNIVINDTFIDLKNTNKMILSKSFDGLLLLREVSPPKND